MNFSDEFLRSSKSKGNWKLDFEASCALFNVNSTSDHIFCDGSVCKVCNVAIDLKVWDALLVSFKYPESKLIELSLYNVELNEQHINDLVLVLTKINYLPVLKLEFISFNLECDMIKIYESLSTIFGNSVFIDYISLRGNRFDSNFFSIKLWERIRSNLFLKALNLSGNSPSNEDITNLVNSIKFHPSLMYISLANCNCNTHSIEMFVTLKHGIMVTTEEDTTWKKTAKLLVDKNKEFKEKNKLRKKLGLTDNMISEIPIPVFNIENVNGHLQLCNNILSLVDLSFNNDLNYDRLKGLFVHIASGSVPSSKGQYQKDGGASSISPRMNISNRPNTATNINASELKILLRGIIADNNEDCVNGITFDYGTNKIIV